MCFREGGLFCFFSSGGTGVLLLCCGEHSACCKDVFSSGGSNGCGYSFCVEFFSEVYHLFFRGGFELCLGDFVKWYEVYSAREIA